METTPLRTTQSADETAQRSSSAPAPGNRDGSILVSDLIDRFMAGYAGRDDSLPQRLRWWQGKLGARRLADVQDDDIFHAVEELAAQRGRVYAGLDADGKGVFRSKGKPFAPATLNRYTAAIGAVFSWSIKQRIAPRGWDSPCRRLGTRAENNEVVRFLSDDERKRLFDACKASKWKPMFALVLLAIVSGARKGELKALRWRDVDLEAGTASIERSKNGDRKTLVLTPNLVAELRKFHGAPGALVFASKRRPDQAFAWESGAWPLALRAAQVKRCRFHDLRHSCASYLAQSGATLLEIADVLGHRNLNVTRRYSHLATGHKAKLINRVLGDLQ